MVLAALGIPRVAEGDDWTGFANLNVVNRRPPTQNLHLCLYAREKEQVDAFHRAGVEGGFRSNGEPGYRLRSWVLRGVPVRPRKDRTL